MNPKQAINPEDTGNFKTVCPQCGAENIYLDFDEGLPYECDKCHCVFMVDKKD